MCRRERTRTNYRNNYAIFVAAVIVTFPSLTNDLMTSPVTCVATTKILSPFSQLPITMSVARATLGGFLVGSIVTLAIASMLSRNKDATKEKDAETTSPEASLPLEIREEQLSRHMLYFGREGMNRLRGARVAIVGVGGVGSHAAHMLARAGVFHLRLIDFDQVSLSSLNRHACATLADVGTAKATCLKRYCRRICPDERYLLVEDVVRMYAADEKGPELLEGHSWDLVIDAIDDVPTKASLLAHCIRNNLRVISCMGAGGKSDPTRLHISDLRTASRDPLASKLRQSLKRLFKNGGSSTADQAGSFMDDMERLTVVYSSEKTVVQLADFTEEQKAEGVHQYGAVDGMRIRIIPVLGTMPAIMGQTLASIALCNIAMKPFSPVTGERIGRNVRNRILQHLKRREQKIQKRLEEEANVTASPQARMISGNWVGPPQVDFDDVEYMLEVWRNRCAVTGDRLGTVLELVRWDPSRPSTCQNLVLMGAKAIKRFDAQGKESIPTEVRRTIEERLQSCRVDAYAAS